MLHVPVGGVALSRVLRRGMVDQRLGPAGRQHELAVCDGDEAVAQRMEPEFRPAGLADASIEMLDGCELAGRAGLGRKLPAPRLPGELRSSFAGYHRRRNVRSRGLMPETTGCGEGR